MTDSPLPRFNGVTLLPDTIRQTRRHFARLAIASAGSYYGAGGEAERLGKSPCEIARYRARDWHNLKAGLRGEHDHSFAFLQRAHWIQTGESVALLKSGGSPGA